MEFKLEKGKVYTLSDYEYDLDGEFLGVYHKGYNNSYYNKLVFKVSTGFCIVDPELKVKDDGTIDVILQIDDFKMSFDDVTKLPEKPKETIEII